MRFLKIMVVIAVCVLGTSLILSAGQNKYGVADTRQITFENPMLVGNMLLPKGEYQVSHTMEGENHIMVFKQMNSKKPVEVRVKCELVPLQAKATATEKTYVLNASNERVLQALVFRGDTAKHMF
jgi:hypothetical protein